MPQRISRQYQGRQRAGGPHLGGGNPFFGGGYGGGHQDGRPDPYEMADYLHGLQQETAAQHHAYQMQRDENHVNLQARLHEIQLTQTERRRLERMREAISHVETDSSLTPDARNDLIMQLRTGMSPLNARLHEQQALRNEIQNRMLEQEETRNRLNLRATQDMLAPGNYDPASGTTIINRGTPNEVRMLFNGTSWVIVPQREANPPVVTPQDYTRIRSAALTEARHDLIPAPNSPLFDQEVAARRRQFGVPAGLSNADAVNWLAERNVQREINALHDFNLPHERDGRQRAVLGIGEMIGELRSGVSGLPPEQAMSAVGALGRLGQLLNQGPLRTFNVEQQNEFNAIRESLPPGIRSRIEIPGIRPPSANPQDAVAGLAEVGGQRLLRPNQGGMAPVMPPADQPVVPPVRPMPMADPGFQPIQPPRDLMPAPPVKPPQDFQVPGFEDVVPVPHNVPAAIGGGVGAFGATQMPMPPQAGPVPQNVPAAIGGGLAAYGRIPLPEVRIPPQDEQVMNEQQMHEMAMEQAIREEEERRRNQSE